MNTKVHYTGLSSLCERTSQRISVKGFESIHNERIMARVLVLRGSFLIILPSIVTKSDFAIVAGFSGYTLYFAIVGR